MLIQARVAHTREMAVVWLPLHRVPRKQFLIVVESQHVLKDIDLDGFSREVVLSVEQKIPEACIAGFVQPSCFAQGLECLIHPLWFRL